MKPIYDEIAHVAHHMEAREVLADAAEYISEHGWTQGNYVDEETGGVCALGAIWSVRNGVQILDSGDVYSRGQFLANASVCDTALALLSNHLAKLPVPGIAVWNDQPERTAEDVILALKGAAHR